MRRVLLGLVLLVGINAVGQQAGPPPGAEIPTNLKRYFVVFAVKNAKSEAAHHNPEMMKGHLEFLHAQNDAGKLMVAGPFVDEGKVGGIFIMEAASADQVKQILNGDPVVSSGFVDVEIHPAMLPDLSPVKWVYADKK